MALPIKAFADGIIMPPDDYWIYETAQEGFIIYDGEREILILSASFNGSVKDFGWIIPVPNEPEVDRVRNDIFDDLYELTTPKQSLLRKIISPEYGYRYGVEPVYNLSAESESDEEKSVNVIDEKRVGIYDIAILFATDVTDLEEWLDKNGYQIPENVTNGVVPEEYFESSDSSGTVTETANTPVSQEESGIDNSKITLQEYIDLEWYFVAVKVNNSFIEDGTLNTYDTGALNPLKITFRTTDMVFPLKISQLSGQSISISLFTLTNNKVWVDNYDADYCEGYFNYSYDTENECSQFDMIYGTMISPDDINDLTSDTGKGPWFKSGNSMYLARHEVSYLDSYSMTSDVLFEEQDNNNGLNDGSMKVYQYFLVPLALLVYGPRNLIRYSSSYFYSPLSIGAILLSIIFLSAIFSILIHIKLRKTTIKSQRIILNLLQFPLISIAGITIGIGAGLIWSLIQIAIGISEDASAINGILTCGFVAIGCISLFYRYQWKR